MIAQFFIEVKDQDDLEALKETLDKNHYNNFCDHIIREDEFGTNNFEELKNMILGEE